MGLTPRDLSKFGTLRSQDEALRTKKSAADVGIDATKKALDDLVRTGAKDSAIDAAKDRLDRQVKARDGIDTQIGKLKDQFDRARDRLPDPRAEAAIPNFRADTPILLLPARIETRYVADALRVRIFPDQPHIDTHEPELTDDEVAAGQFYWQTRWAATTVEAETEAGRIAFAELVKRFRPRRAAWIAFASTPTNLAPAPRADPPTFADVGRRPAPWSRAAFATLLPTQWIVVGYADAAMGGQQEVFRKATSVTSDRLNTGPDPRDETPPPLDAAGIATELPLDAGTTWLTDYAAAEAAGMAVTIGAGDLVGGGSLRDMTIRRLIAVGVNPTLSGPEAASRFETLLRAHVYSDGLAILEPGTPTNVGADTPGGMDQSDSALAAVVDPLADRLSATAARDRLAAAIGIDPTAAHLDRVQGTGIQDQDTDRDMINAVWSATLGQTMDQLFDPQFDDRDIALARRHAVDWLRPGGPLPTLRIGRQPYGILPIVPSTGFKPIDATETALQKVIDATRGLWSGASGKAPNLARTDKSMTENMEELLQQSPMAVSNSFRRVYGPLTYKNSNADQKVAQAQAQIRAKILPSIGITANAFITNMTAEQRQHRLGAPFVQAKIADPAATLTTNYLAAIATEGAKREGRPALVARGNADTLLEALASHALVYELDRSIATIVLRDQFERGVIAAMPARTAMRISELVEVDPPSLPPAARGVTQVAVSTPAAQASLILTERTGRLTTAAYVVDQLAIRGSPDAAAIADYKGVIESLQRLALRPAAELDRSFRGVLDAFSYRLDPWITSLATKRLGHWRAQPGSKGIHIGGFGWVENLKPDSRPDSEGYIHAPSLQQAQAAAILRSGHLAHRDASKTALNIDLSSRRVRLALGLLDGVAQGQPMAALLGYRFERMVRDTDILLAKFILPIRRLFPLRPPPGEVALSQQEAIAARDVVDGVKLLDRRRAGPDWLAGLSLPATADERAALDGIAVRIEDMFDAVGDLLVAEGVYQLAGGNLERASAALAGMDRQARPIDPEIVRTPRTGRAFAQRAGVLLTTTDRPAAWAGFPDDTRTVAAPHLDAWVASLIGDPATYGFGADLVMPDGTTRALSPVGLRDLDLSPASLLMLAQAGGRGRASELQERIAARFAEQVTPPERDVDAELHLTGDAGAGAMLGLAELEALLGCIRGVACKHRAATGIDVAPPGTAAVSGVDVAAMAKRLTAVRAAQDAALATLDETLAKPAPSDDDLTAGLHAISAAGASGATPSMAEPGELRAQASRVATAVRGALARVQTAIDDALPTASADESMEQLVAQMKILLGPSFPVLPGFTIAKPILDEIAASLGDESALIAGQAAPLHGWLTRMAEVRPRLAELARALSAADMLAHTRADLRVAQMPHSPGARWIGLPLTPATPLHVDLSLVLHAPGLDATDPPGTFAGLMCDDWTEVVPNAKETTAIAFHYDAPGARPPQTMLLAVHPDPTAANWLPSTVLACVHEALNLSKIRAVRPQDIDTVGGLLPLVYLPDNYTRDVPGVDFNRMKLAAELTISPALRSVLGKA